LRRASREGAAGFTLAEVAVTLLIVGLILVLMLEGLNGAKITAAHTRNLRLAQDLGLLTLGQVESGMFWEDIDSGRGGSYSEEGYPDFLFEIALGDETFFERDPNEGPFDNWAFQEDWRRQQDDYDEDEEEEAEQPYEKVRVKVTFPKLEQFTNEVILERWVPWRQVYGQDEEDLEAAQETGVSESDLDG